MPGLSDVELTLLVRAGVAAAVGSVLGWERETCSSPASDRTYALVGLGSATVVAIRAAYFPASAERSSRASAPGLGSCERA